MRKPKSSSGKTTICIDKSTVGKLKEISRKGESYDKLFRRILSGQGEIWVDVLAVDGDSPAKHQVLIKLGEIVYFWDGNQFTPMDPRKIKTVVEGVPSG